MTLFACEPWGKRPGDEHVIHPWRTDLAAFEQEVGGFLFDDVRLGPLATAFPGFIAQIRYRKSLRSVLSEEFYAIRAREVVRGRGVRTASEIRAHVGLSGEQKLILLLFDKDDLLERVWIDAEAILAGVVKAGFDYVVAPSYSTWWPRPRPEHLRNFKRSLLVCQVLHALGANAIPRVAWVVEFDAKRFAAWANQNSSIETVALDWMTYRSVRDWRCQVAGLRTFDEATGCRLSYLINGPSTEQRFREIFSVVDAERVCLTNATCGPPADRTRRPRQLDLTLEARLRATHPFVANVRSMHEAIGRARSASLLNGMRH